MLHQRVYFPLPVFLTANAFLFELFEMFFFISFLDLPLNLLLPKNLLVILILFIKIQQKNVKNNLSKKTLTYFVTLQIAFYLKIEKDLPYIFLLNLFLLLFAN